MNRYLEAVKEFHDNFGHPVNDVDGDVPLNLRQLRIKLLFEELEELADATDCKQTFNNLCMSYPETLAKSGHTNIEDGDNRDKVEEIDALSDIQYVLSGAILAMGHHENFDSAFEEVQRSNMSKMCQTYQEAEDTQAWYLEKGVGSRIIEKGDKWIVLRDVDDKILKNKYYSAASLEKFV